MKKFDVNVPEWTGLNIAAVINYGCSTVLLSTLMGLVLHFTGQIQEPNFNLLLQTLMLLITIPLGLFIKRVFAKFVVRRNHAPMYIWFKTKTELVYMSILSLLTLVFNTEGFGYLIGII